MACSCSGSSSAYVQPVSVSSISPCACKGQLSSRSNANPQAAYTLSPIVTMGTVVIPRQCAIAMVPPVSSYAQSQAIQASGIRLGGGCGCRK